MQKCRATQSFFFGMILIIIIILFSGSTLSQISKNKSEIVLESIISK